MTDKIYKGIMYTPGVKKGSVIAVRPDTAPPPPPPKAKPSGISPKGQNGK